MERFPSINFIQNIPTLKVALNHTLGVREETDVVSYSRTH